MTKEIIFALVALFLVTSLTNILATLKTILISKKIMNPVYFVVFLDALIFATVITKITSSVGFHYTIAYGLGRTAGVYIGGKIEERLALGILEVDIFFNNKDKMTSVANCLREEGYTVNNYLASGYHEDVRYKVEVVIKRKEFKVLERILDEYGVQSPTLKIKNISKVEGKITTTSTQAT